MKLPIAPCEQYKICDSSTHRFFVILVMIVIIISCSYSYLESQTKINDITTRIEKQEATTEQLKTEVVLNTIQDIGLYEDKDAELTAMRLTIRIKDAYADDLSLLQNKFQQGIYSDTRFNNIIITTIKDGRIIQGVDSGYLIIIKDKLLYNDLIPSKEFASDLSILPKVSYNLFLSEDFVNMIDHHRSEIKIIEPKKKSWHSNHFIADTLTTDKIHDIIKSEGLDGLSGYYVLKPAYITKIGDIFNVNDFDTNGVRADNFKIAVVPYISLYEYIMNYRNHHISTINKMHAEAIARAELDRRNIYYNSISSLLLHLCVIFLILNVSRCLFFRNLIDKEDLTDIEKKLKDRV